MAILTKEQLFAERKRPSVVLSVPELGEDAELRVQGILVGDELDITEFSTEYDSAGTARTNRRNDVLMTFIKAVAEPEVSILDAVEVWKLHPNVVKRVIAASMAMSGRTESAFDQIRQMLRTNAVMARLYRVCVEKLGRLPSELAHVTESEFMTLLALLENDAEDEANNSTQE